MISALSYYIIGADEVGYGSYAGPVVVGAVRAKANWNLEGLNDSKKLSEKRRDIMNQKLMELVKTGEIWYALAERSSFDIDVLGLALAQKESYIEAIRDVWHDDVTVILDGLIKLPHDQIDNSKTVSIIKADTTEPTVMAASIIAKVYRDGKMRHLHAKYPEYGWDKNVGYGTPAHIEAINKFGLCILHRKSFKIKSVNNTP